MTATAKRRTRVGRLVALGCCVALLWAVGVQCALLAVGHSAGHDGHERMSVAALAVHHAQPGHAHIGAVKHQLKPDVYATMLRPRADSPLRLVGVVALAVVLAVFAVLELGFRSRGPPGGWVRARTGRVVLRDLCVIRC